MAEISGEGSCDISAFKLPVKTAESTRHGFGKTEKKAFVSLGELQQGWQSGASGEEGPGRTKIRGKK